MVSSTSKRRCRRGGEDKGPADESDRNEKGSEQEDGGADSVVGTLAVSSIASQHPERGGEIPPPSSLCSPSVTPQFQGHHRDERHTCVGCYAPSAQASTSEHSSCGEPGNAQFCKSILTMAVRVHCHFVLPRYVLKDSLLYPAVSDERHFILKRKRALKLWQTSNAPIKDTKTSFVCKPWAVRTAAHYKVVAQLSERVWGEIHEASSLAIGSVDVDAVGRDSDVEDPEDLVQLSSDGEEMR